MTHFAVSFGLADGTCAITGNSEVVPVVVEVEDDLPFPLGHIAANRRAAEVTGVDFDGESVKRVATQPFEWASSLKFKEGGPSAAQVDAARTLRTLEEFLANWEWAATGDDEFPPQGELDEAFRLAAEALGVKR